MAINDPISPPVLSPPLFAVLSGVEIGVATGVVTGESAKLVVAFIVSLCGDLRGRAMPGLIALLGLIGASTKAAPRFRSAHPGLRGESVSLWVVSGSVCTLLALNVVTTFAVVVAGVEVAGFGATELWLL